MPIRQFIISLLFFLFVFTGAGRLWMASDKGIYIEKNGAFVSASSIFPFAKNLDNVSCFKSAFIYDSIKNTVWSGTDAGLFCVDLNRRQYKGSLADRSSIK